MVKTVEGRTALVTGSTRRGIGAATAMKLAAEGANIVLNYGTGGTGEQAKERAEELKSQLAEMGAVVLVVEAAVHREDDVRRMFQEVRARFGSVDILVNNAGGLWKEQDFAEIDTRHWDQAVRPEIDGTFYCIREALPDMRRNHWGRIVNICLDVEVLELLLAAQQPHRLAKYPYDFVIAKQAKRQVADLIALPEFKHGITLNNILPGIIEEMDNAEVQRIIQQESPQSIYFDPIDVANTVAFLCSDAARGVTRSDLRIPGNLYQRL